MGNHCIIGLILQAIVDRVNESVGQNSWVGRIIKKRTPQ